MDILDLIAQKANRTILDWTLQGSPVPPPPAIKVATIARYMAEYGCRTFIETGTFLGETTALIGSLEGVKVFTIELSKDLHARAEARFANQPNITCLQGDSAEVLPRILAQVDEPALLWLDGHYSGGITAQAENCDTPIVEEMTAVHKHRNIPHVILIDDARCFDPVTFPDYPSLEDFQRFSKTLFPKHGVQVMHDIIRVTPPR